MNEREQFRRAVAREVRRAVRSIGMTWKEWRAASESPHYYVIVMTMPCAEMADCRHATACLMGRN